MVQMGWNERVFQLWTWHLSEILSFGQITLLSSSFVRRRTLNGGKAQVMLINKKFTQRLWTEAVNTMCYRNNHVCIRPWTRECLMSFGKDMSQTLPFFLLNKLQGLLLIQNFGWSDNTCFFWYILVKLSWHIIELTLRGFWW